ncbi:MAG: succinate dehydrogenase, cytochrome b556 subunit [Gallionellaceae bacterium]|nr:succinate dehydrogenase, cytochrome b556 subunit [Gallionellaceae bacterium]
MAKTRPIFFNLFQMKLPIGGWVSIFHRVSGAALSLAVLPVLYAWMLSLRSPEDYAAVTGFLSGWFGFLILLGVVWATLHHLLAGLRHLGFDFGWGEGRERARLTAWAVLLAALALTGLFALGCLS